MEPIELQQVGEQVVRHAREQGYILARQIREILSKAGASESLWKDVLAQTRASFRYRRGRYYFTEPVSERVREEVSKQQSVRQIITEVIQQLRTLERQKERREQERIAFVHPVQVQFEDGRVLTFLSRDLSETGIRLISTRRCPSLLGQKVQLSVSIPLLFSEQPDTHTLRFLVRILWTSAVGEDLVEHGGTILEVQTSPKV